MFLAFLLFLACHSKKNYGGSKDQVKDKHMQLSFLYCLSPVQWVINMAGIWCVVWCLQSFHYYYTSWTGSRSIKLVYINSKLYKLPILFYHLLSLPCVWNCFSHSFGVCGSLSYIGSWFNLENIQIIICIKLYYKHYKLL